MDFSEQSLKKKTGVLIALQCSPMLCFFQHQQCLALFNRIKFTRLLLTALIAFTKKEVMHISTKAQQQLETDSVYCMHYI